MKKIEKNPKLMAILAILTATSIVAGKYLGIDAGEYMRFSLENMPIIFAGLAFGPIPGAVVGICADLIGCALMGWAPIPWVTVGAAAIGLVSGFVPMLFKKTDISLPLLVTVTVALAHIIGSLFIKSIGLSDFYGIPYYDILLWRVTNYLVVGSLDGAVVYLLMKNKEIKKRISSIKGK